MKKSLLFLVMSFLSFIISYAQKVPEGMKYQAVARNTAGEVLANRTITLRIELKGAPAKGARIYYSEEHIITTNQLGLFDLVVGEGKNNMGVFNAIPWSSEDIWMAVSLKEKGTDFSAVTESRLLAVPYALHALTASRLVDNTHSVNILNNNASIMTDNFPGVPANVWSLQGNYNSNPLTDKLGTTDFVDLVMVTNNMERLRIMAGGDISIKRSLSIGANLMVDSSVYLNRVSGSTINYGPFKVDRLSPTMLSGTLTVDGASILNASLTVNGPTDLNSRLFVNNLSPTKLTGTLQVGGITDLNSALNVNNISPVLLTGTLRVNKPALFKDTVLLDNPHQSDSTTTGALVIKGGLGLGGNFNVGGASSFGGSVKFKAPVTITDGTESTSTTTGALIVTGGIGTGKNLNVGGTLTVAGITSLTNVTQSTLSTNGALVVSGGTGIAGNLNVGGSLTATGIATVNNTLNVNGSGDYIANFVNSSDANGISIKVGSAIPARKNHFITFMDNTGKTVGSIEGEKVEELSNNSDYVNKKEEVDLAVTQASISEATAALSIVKAGFTFAGAVSSTSVCVGFGACLTAPVPSLIIAATAGVIASIANEVSVSIGLVAAIAHQKSFQSNAVSKIGVTYQSGNGDYAEWLPKTDKNEKFIPGYIVGLKNGKISLNTEGADKLFVVSTQPIMLGNTPMEGKEAGFVKIAFMGQVPVHILGKVKAGDYIVPSGINNGFGLAISPENMKSEDYIKIVGMAWSTADNNTYSQINVAVGLNNGDISKVVAEQNKEIISLKEQINQTNSILSKLVPGYKEAAGIKENIVVAQPAKTNYKNTSPPAYLTPDASNIIYFEVTDAQIESAVVLAKKLYIEHGGNVNTNLFWNKMTNDPTYKINVLRSLKNEIRKNIDTHKEINGQLPMVK